MLRALIYLFLFSSFLSCKSSVAKQENDTILVLQNVLSLSDLAPYLHLDDGNDSVLRILQNELIDSDLSFKVEGRKVEFSKLYSRETRFVEVVQLHIEKHNAQITLRIPYEGVKFVVELNKDNNIWQVKNKSLVEQ